MLSAIIPTESEKKPGITLSHSIRQAPGKFFETIPFLYIYQDHTLENDEKQHFFVKFQGAITCFKSPFQDINTTTKFLTNHAARQGENIKITKSRA